GAHEEGRTRPPPHNRPPPKRPPTPPRAPPARRPWGGRPPPPPRLPRGIDSPRRARGEHDPLAGPPPHQRPGRPDRSRHLAAGPIRRGGAPPRPTAIPEGRSVGQAPLPPLGGWTRRPCPSRNGGVGLSAPGRGARGARDRPDASRPAPPCR